MVRADARTVGVAAERLAARFLQSNGLVPVAHNFGCRLGEIDLIMRHSECLVFVEVRYRARNRFSRAGLTVDIHKQRKIVRTAALFLSRHEHLAKCVVRFDVVAIDADGHGNNRIDWLRDAFRPADASL